MECFFVKSWFIMKTDTHSDIGGCGSVSQSKDLIRTPSSVTCMQVSRHWIPNCSRWLLHWCMNELRAPPDGKVQLPSVCSVLWVAREAMRMSIDVLRHVSCLQRASTSSSTCSGSKAGTCIHCFWFVMHTGVQNKLCGIWTHVGCLRWSSRDYYAAWV